MRTRTWPLTWCFGGAEGTRTPDPLLSSRRPGWFGSPRFASDWSRHKRSRSEIGLQYYASPREPSITLDPSWTAKWPMLGHPASSRPGGRPSYPRRFKCEFARCQCLDSAGLQRRTAWETGSGVPRSRSGVDPETCVLDSHMRLLDATTDPRYSPRRRCFQAIQLGRRQGAAPQSWEMTSVTGN